MPATTGHSLLWKFGLYNSAEQLSLQVVKKTRELNLPVLPSYLSTFVDCLRLLGLHDRIPALIEEMRLIEQTRSRILPQGFLSLLVGMTALGTGDHETAVAHLQEAFQDAQIDSFPGLAPTALAWLGAAELAIGDIAGAHEHTAEAVSLPDVGQFYTAQEVWWWHYQASCSAAHVDRLAAEGIRARTAGKGSGFRVAPLTDELFAILDRARHEMLDYIAGIGDEGSAAQLSQQGAHQPRYYPGMDAAGGGPRDTPWLLLQNERQNQRASQSSFSA